MEVDSKAKCTVIMFRNLYLNLSAVLYCMFCLSLHTVMINCLTYLWHWWLFTMCDILSHFLLAVLAICKMNGFIYLNSKLDIHGLHMMVVINFGDDLAFLTVPT